MVFNENGQRKYLNDEEEMRFRTAILRLPESERLFCEMLLFTGCRLSEALATSTGNFDFDDEAVVIRSLKKRRPGVFRSVPLPSDFTKRIEKMANERSRTRGDRMWPWSRTKGWNVVKRPMSAVGIDGIRACPKALRHSFAIRALRRGVPISFVQRWLGHSRLETTSIYTFAIGAEERDIASRMWSD